MDEIRFNVIALYIVSIVEEGGNLLLESPGECVC